MKVNQSCRLTGYWRTERNNMAKVMGGKITKLTYDGVDINPAFVSNFQVDIPEGYDGSVSRVVCIAKLTTQVDGSTELQIDTCATYQSVLLAIAMLNARLEMHRQSQSES